MAVIPFDLPEPGASGTALGRRTRDEPEDRDASWGWPCSSASTWVEPLEPSVV